MKYYGLLSVFILFTLYRADALEPTEVRIQSNNPLVLTCGLSEDGQISWLKNGEALAAVADAVEITGKDLKILKPTPKDVANYTCQLTVPGAAAKTHLIRVTADVKLKKLPSSVNAAEGETFRIECEVAVGEPKPTLKWLKRAEESEVEEELAPGTNESHIQLDSANDYMHNVLIIRNLVMEDRANYVCRGENSFSNDTSVVLLRVKDKYAALWPFLGIVAEVVVLCIIIFIYERRRSKAEFEESDNEQNDAKNAADNSKGGELRHRK